MSTYRSKSISLADDVWDAFDQARAVHGSYNKTLQYVFGRGLADLLEVQQQVAKSREIVRQHMERSSSVPERDKRGVRSKGDKTR